MCKLSGFNSSVFSEYSLFIRNRILHHPVQRGRINSMSNLGKIMFSSDSIVGGTRLPLLAIEFASVALFAKKSISHVFFPGFTDLFFVGASKK